MKVLTEESEIVPCENIGKEKTTEIQELLKSHEDQNNDCPPRKLIQYPGISEILPSLYLCGAGAFRPDILEKLQIAFVVNAAPELPDTPLPDTKPLYIQIPVMDLGHVDLKAHFNEVADLIEEVRQSDGITLVHCVAGVSRSASLCIAYLMKYFGMSLREAFLHIRSARPQIRPNVGFFRQLIEYEEDLTGKKTVGMVFYESLGQEIPDVYESEYRSTELFYQKYRRNIKRR